jgi:hypothetical protein
MIMARNQNNNGSNKLHPCRKTMLLIVTLFMTWTSTYKLFSKYQDDVTSMNEQDSSNSTTALRTTETPRTNIRINHNNKETPSGTDTNQKSSQISPPPKHDTIKIKNNTTTVVSKVGPKMVNNIQEENIELENNHGR